MRRSWEARAPSLAHPPTLLWLIVVSLANKHDDSLDFPFFEVGIIGLPIVVVGLLYVWVASHWLLPERNSALFDLSLRPKEYIVTAMVTDESSIAGQTIEEAGLRNLEGLFLVEIHRSGVTMPAAEPDSHLYSGDHLMFAGDVSKVKNLWKIKGLKPTDQEDNVVLPMVKRIIVEAIVNPYSKLVGKTTKKSDFREKYSAAIISVHRNGAPIHERIGDVVLQGGDCLLLVAKPSFVEKHRNLYNNSDFFIIDQVGDRPLKRDWIRLILAPGCAIAMVALNASEVIDLLTVALCAASVIIVTGCLTWEQIRSSVNMPVIITIGASFAMADSLDNTGVASELASNLVLAHSNNSPSHPFESVKLIE